MKYLNKYFLSKLKDFTIGNKKQIQKLVRQAFIKKIKAINFIVTASQNLIVHLLIKMRHMAFINEDYQLVQLPVIYSTKTQNQKLITQKYIKPIHVNLADTQYPVIQEVCDQLGWKMQYSDNKNWDIKWTDTAITTDILSKMSQHQKINHFPGMSILHRKNNLTKCIQRIQEQYPKDYDFYPLTFLLPYDKHKLRSYVQDLKRQNLRETFIVKPQASCQGRGIFLTSNINQIEQFSNCVVQKYVVDPLLYKNLKFDLRVYALVAGCDPLRIYIYNEGLTRFATQKYFPPNEDNIDNLYMHLTNYAINKDHPNYIYNDSVDNLSYGHKKSLAQFFQTLKNMGLKAHQYWSDIKDIIIKTMISGQPHLQHQYRLSQPHNLKNNMCFQVLGFDFMIDGNGKAYLLEINHTPSFTTDTPLDDLVKSNLVRDTLILMNINSKSRDKILSEVKSQNERRVFTGKRLKYTPQERLKQVQQLQKERDQWQKTHMGSFEKIYPSRFYDKQCKYQQFIAFSSQSYKDSTGNARSKQSPSKFRVKKLQTIHNQDDSSRNQSHLQRQKNNLRKQSNSLNRNVSTAAKINSRQIQYLRSNSPKRPNGNMLDPQKQLQFQEIKIKQKLKKTNPIVVGSILSSPYNENNFQVDRQYNSMKKLDSLRREKNSQKINTTLKQIRQFTQESQNLEKINQYNKIQQIERANFLKTRDQELTMFSKMLLKTRQ